MFAALTLIFGLGVGSFINVLLARLPAHRTLCAPGSSCPTCGAAIAWHDNIPILSFLALRGRCRACAGRIAWRYPIVEGVTALLFLAAYLRYGLDPQFFVSALLLSALVAITG